MECIPCRATHIHTSTWGPGGINACQTIGGLEKDIDALRTELAARDDMIGEKEERIAQIKRRAQVRKHDLFVSEIGPVFPMKSGALLSPYEPTNHGSDSELGLPIALWFDKREMTTGRPLPALLEVCTGRDAVADKRAAAGPYGNDLLPLVAECVL